MTLEGTGGSRLLQAVRTHGNGTEQPTTIKLATVVRTSPITLRIDGDSIDTPSQCIVMTETYANKRKQGDRVIVAIANDGQLIYVIDKAVS